MANANSETSFFESVSAATDTAANIAKSVIGVAAIGAALVVGVRAGAALGDKIFGEASHVDNGTDTASLF